jgi:hypothetical protein
MTEYRKKILTGMRIWAAKSIDSGIKRCLVLGLALRVKVHFYLDSLSGMRLCSFLFIPNPHGLYRGFLFI